MAYSSVTRRRGIDTSVSRDQILAAAEDLILAGGFAEATVTELAERAGVSRATVFSRFGSKLGVLEALSVRCSGGPQMQAIRAAVALDDAARILPTLISASSEHWEVQGHILRTMKAVAELEPDARAFVEDQRRDQRESMETVVATLLRGGRTSELSRPKLVAALHLVTSLEAFMELRRDAGLSLQATKDVLTRTAEGLLD